MSDYSFINLVLIILFVLILLSLLFPNYIKKDIMCKYFWDNGKKFVGYYDINKLADECKFKFGIDGISILFIIVT